jgi:carboxymethylenebutenolidase
VQAQARETDWDERDKQLSWADRWFINHHDPRDLTAVDRVIAKLAVAGHHEPSAVDARRRITAFFRRHVVTNDE